MNNWRLKVEEFGKIKSADIEISPFTLLIGDNNSGKSYLMSLIYGIVKMDLIPGLYKFKDRSNDYKTVVKWLRKIQSEELEKIIYMDEDIFKCFINILNDVFRNNKRLFIESIFNTYIDFKKIEVDFEYDNKLYLEKSLGKSAQVDGEKYNVVFGYIDSKGNKRAQLIFPKDIFELCEFAIAAMIEKIIKLNCLESGMGSGYYLPTSRTGFMLTHKTLAQVSINDKFNVGETKKNLLTKPCSDFLAQIASITTSKSNDKYKNVIDFIENNIIDGKIDVEDIHSSDFKYIPNGSNTALPMFVSSGVVTEMTPLLLILKYKEDLKALMMEEPEMCLHPKLQWLVARTLIQIVNAGTPVIITTHSDNILQHINNMIKLFRNPNKKNLMENYQYTKEEVIDQNKIKMYQFNVSNHQTTIEELKCGEFGFEAPTFNEMLVSLMEQCRTFEVEE